MTRRRRALHGFVAVTATSLLVAGSVVLVKAADGAFSSAYVLTASFSSAGQDLHPGSEVVTDGAQVGSVRSIALVDRRALVTMSIDRGFAVPDGTVATIEPLNLFGAEQVSLLAPPGARATGDLPPGGRIARTVVQAELGQLFRSADPLLSRLDTPDLARVVSELAQAYRGQGPEIKSSLVAATALSTVLARTTTDQLRALDALTRLSTVLAPEGPTINSIAGHMDRSFPLFNAAQAAFARLLADLGTLSGELASLVSDYRPEIDTILNQGGNVIRVLLAQRSDVASLVDGLAQYVERFALSGSSATLPGGSRFGHFKTFVVWNDVQQLVCSLVAPAQHGLSFLAPLQQAIGSNGGPLDCSKQIAAFDAAQRAPGPVTRGAAPAAPAAAAGPRAALAGASSAAAQLAKALYGALGQPSSARAGSARAGSGQGSTLAAYLASLLGGQG